MVQINQVNALLWRNMLVYRRSRGDWVKDIIYSMIVVSIVYYWCKIYIFNTILLPLGIPILVMSFHRKLIINVIHEKTEEVRSVLRIQSMQDISYYIGNLIFTTLQTLCICMCVVLPILYQHTHIHINWKLLTLHLVVFSLASYPFHIIISSFFKSIKLVSATLTLLQFIQAIGFFVPSLFAKQLYQQYLLSLLPQLNISLALSELMHQPSPMQQQQQEQSKEFLSSNDLLMVQCINICLYGLISLVIEGIIKLKFNKKQKIKSQEYQQNKEMDELGGNLIYQNQDQSSAVYHEKMLDNKKKRVQIKDLRKQYNNVVAVDGVSFNLYEGEIFCLLGHNGAGKSTTINCITGIVEKDQGNVEVLGMNVDNTDKYKIQRNFGYCMQKDIMIEKLTVYEHMEFICKLKGIYIQDRQSIQKYIHMCGLDEHVRKTPKQLSGGLKRKLSICMSLVGDSNIIFLDEPTSGMDPKSRIEFWEIIRNAANKLGKTILLTTHFLDEAEELANRTGIMHNGQLLILGSNQYIKKIFQIGYTLTIQQQQINADFSNQQIKEFQQIVEKQIPNSLYDNNSSSNNTLKFKLQFNSEQYFSKAFHILETSNINTQIHISLEQNTLEDAFILISEQQHKLIPGDQQTSQESTQNLLQQLEDSQFIGQYSFIQQIQGIFLRKYMIFISEFSSILLLVLPMIFFIGFFGVFKYIYSKYIIHIVQQYDTLVPVIYGILSFSITIGFSINCTLYIGLPVKEKEIGLKTYLRSSGIRPISYWLGTFIFDLLVYMILLTTYILIIFITDTPLITEFILQLYIYMILFGISLIVYAYFWSTIFSTEKNAFKSYPIILIFFTTFIPQLINELLSRAPEYIRDTIQYIFYALSPLDTIASVLEHIVRRNSKTPFDEYQYKYTENELIGFFTLQIILYSSIAILSDYIKYPCGNKLLSMQTQSQTQQDVVIKTVDLQKTYKKQVALDKLNLSIKKSEIYTLLGPNGAGKSTTLNILTGYIKQGSGSYEIENIDISKWDNRLYQKYGLCPQQNTLWEQLTIEQQLRVTGYLRGIRQNAKYIYILMQILDIYIYRHIQIKNLSGGNRRKVAIATSLIGVPQLLFLDEPSTGLDPISKRNLWYILNTFVRKFQTSIILTTHSMLEAEQLSDRLGLLFKGQLQCQGTINQLKETYGKGYYISIKIDSNSNIQTQAIHTIVLNTFSSAQVFSNEPNCITYQILTHDFLLSKAFGTLRTDLLNLNGVKDFIVKRSSLDQVFLLYSRQQESINN